jgi:SAM-dependent methyltransferase
VRQDEPVARALGAAAGDVAFQHRERRWLVAERTKGGDGVLVTSRSAAEYHAMFDLTSDALAPLRVLDCCAGASSLAAETAAYVVAADPAYGRGRAMVADEAQSGLVAGSDIIEDQADRFEWSWYGVPARRTAMRTAAMRRFVADLAARPSRYVAGALPDLPFADESFDLVLCSHLLFTWADRFDRDWHHAALSELVRVARSEVRIFPLVHQGSGDPVAFLPSLRSELQAAGHRNELRRVPYRFQRGADQMLVVLTERSVTGEPREADR